MIDLEPFIALFNTKFPEYGDEPYNEICDLAESLADDNIQNLIANDQFDEFVACVSPLIGIKNYKTQIPFPLNLRAAIQNLVDVKNLVQLSVARYF